MEGEVGRYYSPEYGWRWLEHPHIITITHHPDGRENMSCLCGAKTMKLGYAGNWVAEHRKHVFGIGVNK